jgi:1,2-diacylglycerol 3-alpha-glucosyltransferase
LWSESTAHDQRRRWPAVEVLKKRFLRKCDGCVVPGKSSFEYLSALHVPQRRISVAPDAVDNSFFANRAGAARAQERHHRLALDLPERFFLFVGRLIAAKGVFDLLEAYAALPWEVRSEVGLVFVGNGDARTELQCRARSIQPGCIQFSGFVQKDQLPVYYGLADTFVFPTHTDPWGLVVNEAMASGLPVISTSVAGCTADLVIGGWNGLLVPPADVRELAAAMEMLARSSELRKQFGARSAEKIMQNSPEACAQGLADAAFFACRGHA